MGNRYRNRNCMTVGLMASLLDLEELRSIHKENKQFGFVIAKTSFYDEIPVIFKRKGKKTLEIHSTSPSDSPLDPRSTTVLNWVANKYILQTYLCNLCFSFCYDSLCAHSISCATENNVPSPLGIRYKK